MSTGRRWAMVGGGAALLAGLVLLASSRVRAPAPVNVGFRAPDIQARSIEGAGQMRHLDDYRGDVILLNVWATWCDPCRDEMPSIERLYQEFGPRGLRVVAVSIDDAGAEGDIRDFAREYGLTFDILHDPTGEIQRNYQLVGVPESFLIGRDGVIRKKAFQSDWYSTENRALVANLLASDRARPPS